MLNMSREMLQSTHRELEQASYNHDRWYKELIRSIVCRLPHDQRDLSDDAFQQCRFGQWYYSKLPAELVTHPTFVSIETEHTLMHRLASRLLSRSANSEVIDPIDYDNFASALDRLRLNVETLRHEIEETLYNRDPLTGARNRVSMLSDLRKMHELVKRNTQSVSIAIMDIDHFKSINDTYGHPVGDIVLAALARFVIVHTRPYDHVYRYGGEEFLISMGNTDIETAQVIIDRLREAIAKFTAVSEGTINISVSASFGLSSLKADATVEDAIKQADEALYVSKSSGRNKVTVWEESRG